ncbi:MAG TPA: TfuA-like protein, partial [Bacteroidia bacterium]|nr:TfuA-like protein [Bacteroidia bacterium]
MSDYYIHKPTHIFLIDGEFQQNLSPWHKELVFCLHEGVNVYGSASMGALRAADLCRVGMQGYGTIFEWYREGTITDDAEVAVAYTEDYRHQTIPIVNLRASDVAPGLLAKAKGIHYASRTPKALGIDPGAIVNQKRIDAIGLLKNYKSIGKVPFKKDDKHLSHLFHAQNERDRQVIVNGNRIALQHIDAHVCLTSPNIHEEIWNSNNRALALILAEMLNIDVTEDEIRLEAKRTLSRGNAEDVLERNALTLKEATSLIEENARVRKLHKAL